MKRTTRSAAFGGSLALAVLTTMPAQAATNVGEGGLDAGLTALSLINTNDFHGHFTKDFACAVTSVQREVPGTTFLSAGDNVGGSPFESAAQNDEPAIDFLNALDLKASAVGNHEFDKGMDDLTGRVQARADWTYLGANVYRAGTTTPALPEYKIIEQNGVKIGVVGAVTKDVPSLVSKDGITGLEFGDPVDAVNRVAKKITDSGEADVVVAEYHEGAPTGESTLGDQMAASSQFADIVEGTSPDVDAIFTGHTHQKYAWDGPATDGTRPVIQTDYYASHLGVLTLGYDEESGEVTQYKMTNREVAEPTAACESDPRYTAAARIVDDAAKKAEVIGQEKIGTKTAPITTAYSAEGSRDDRMRESTLSNMIAQSYVDSINKPSRPGGVEIGVMNPGGVRADLGADGETVTYAEAASVMPFSNTVVTTDLTGAQFKQVLEEQWQPEDSSRPFLKLGLSENVTYTYDPNAAAGERISTVMIDGEEMDDDATYTIASNSFLLAGGDNFTTFAEGTNTRDSGLIDQSLFVEWIKENSPLSPSFAKHAVAVEDQPTEVTAGEEVTFDVSGLDLTSKGSPTNTEVTVSIGETELGTFPVTAGQSDAPPYPTRDGSAAVTVTIPEGISAGDAVFTITAEPTETAATFPVTVNADSGPEPTATEPTGTDSPTGTDAPSGSESSTDGESTVSGPPVETGQIAVASNGKVLVAVAGCITLFGGAYLLARRRTNG